MLLHGQHRDCLRQRKSLPLFVEGLGGEQPWADCWGKGPIANPVMLHRLRSLVRATERLWRDLKVSPNAVVLGHAKHSERVALLSLKIARALRLSEDLARRIYRAAYLHDVGKIALPAQILRKEGAFTVEERGAVQRHSIIGHELLKIFLPGQDLAEIALFHHERYDGNGYPSGLQRTRIPLAARVIAIADSLDAMLSRSAYRSKVARSAAWAEVTRQAGQQFDPNIVETLMRRRDP